MAAGADNRFLEQLGQRMRAARAARGLNLHQLARLTGISASALSLIETAKRDPRVTTLSRIARALRLPMSALLEGPGPDDTPAPPPARDEDSGGYDLGEYR
ncbi:helix-turn-helix transcriptional regulator (plasmid) [Paroceanicella profunda]|uniref:Helix-turn-helix transcriptional regulator n=1 Tax=Paroceanicella profunda TaxID=2579971 RepID=A0A5B8G5B2_9RHOB|nr:helix-turn-helix transcriptional regulator [Paroceanicella profunda]QDL94492.1 helix-turn-helix transcriptional regulator [Paroceanicella profunda]